MKTRAGLVALAGRPNVGKSTLVNAIVGQKVAIVSDKPQTTRRAIRGVATRDDAQLVLTDLPGVQKPLDELTERMQRRVERELSETDVALMVLNAEQGVGPGDRWIANALKNAPCPVVIAVNKVDRLDRPHVVIALEAAGELDVGDDIFPVSARKGTGVAALADHLFSARARVAVPVRRRRSSATCRPTSTSPSSCASRSCAARSRRCRTRSRSSSRRSRPTART